MQESLARRLRVLRAERGLTLRDAAARMDVRAATLSDIEHGRSQPHDVTLGKIARAYEIPVEDLLEEPVPLDEGPDTGQPGTERTARDIAHAEALRQEALDRKAARRTLASEGLDRTSGPRDPYDRTVYDALKVMHPEELAGALLDAEQDYVHTAQEYDQLQTRLKQEKEANARLRQDLAELRAEAEREGARR